MHTETFAAAYQKLTAVDPTRELNRVRFAVEAGILTRGAVRRLLTGALASIDDSIVEA